MSRKARKYTNEFKQEAVQLALKSLPVVGETAKSLGIPSSTLRTWIYQLKETPSESDTTQNSGKSMSDLMEENIRLHKELAIVKEEKEILKKAAAYFAQHQK